MIASLDPSLVLPEGCARDALYAFAHTMLETDRMEQAVQAFRVLVRFAPTDERAWLGLGACHEKLEQDDVASELYGAGAMVASPPSARCHLALARLARRRGDMLEAVEYIDAAGELASELDDRELSALVDYERRQS